jgi:hypothetical protein
MSETVDPGETHPALMQDVGTLVVRQVSPDPSRHGCSHVDADVVSANNHGAAVPCRFRARLDADEIAAMTKGDRLHYERLPGSNDVRVCLLDTIDIHNVRLEHLDHHPALADTAVFTPHHRRVWTRTSVPTKHPAPGEGVIVELRNRIGSAYARSVVTTGTTSSDTSLRWHVGGRAARYVLGPDLTAVRFESASRSTIFGTSMTVRPLRDATPFTGPASGCVADVLAYDGPARRLQVEAEGLTVVFHYPDGTGRRALVIAGGLYQGQLVIPPGPGLLAVSAIRGTWSVREVR